MLATPAKTVFVLPNNKNIVMAAEQTVPLATDRKVIVLPTKTIPQGLAAMLAFDPDAPVEDMADAMMEAASHVGTGQVTFAARDSEFGGMKIKEGDILALENGKLVFTEKDPVKAISKLTRSMVRRDTSFITLIYGGGRHRGAGRGGQARHSVPRFQSCRHHRRQRRSAGVLFHRLGGIARRVRLFLQIAGYRAADRPPCLLSPPKRVRGKTPRSPHGRAGREPHGIVV